MEFPEPTQSCAECGVPVLLDEVGEHACDPEHLLDVAVLELREELGGLDLMNEPFEIPRAPFDL